MQSGVLGGRTHTWLRDDSARGLAYARVDTRVDPSGYRYFFCNLSRPIPLVGLLASWFYPMIKPRQHGLREEYLRQTSRKRSRPCVTTAVGSVGIRQSVVLSRLPQMAAFFLNQCSFMTRAELLAPRLEA